ncbi:MAG: hypothetical protein HY017_14435 [Betaproteobacteria bacterium]|nr:hypothetical protein [Betaproteobacteria bacterium]
MSNISLRGLNDRTLLRLKSSARRRGISVNRLIVETLQRQYAAEELPFDDLDTLAGTWSRAEAAEFAAAIAPLGEIEPGLWAAQPNTAYRVKRKVTRRREK